MTDHDTKRAAGSPARDKRMIFKRIVRWAIGILLVAFLVIQFIPVDRTNPPVGADVPTSPEVKAVLRRACYDCHSNETVWTWYTYIAPASWLVAKDIQEGREHLNFSTWNNYDTKKQVKLMRESWEEIEEGEMPLWFYTPMHRDAQLSTVDKNLLRKWALGSTGSVMPPQDEDDLHD